MKIIFLSILAFVGCSLQAQNNGLSRNGHLTNKVFISELDGRSISFYLNHSRVDNQAKSFYRGEIDFHSGNTFQSITDSLMSSSSDTRPFYFFIFNQIVDLSNAKFDERVVAKCQQFLEDYPCEFFHSFSQPELNINVVKWTNFIGTSLNDKVSFALFRSKVDSKIRANCADSQDLVRSFMSEIRMCLIK